MPRMIQLFKTDLTVYTWDPLVFCCMLILLWYMLIALYTQTQLLGHIRIHTLVSQKCLRLEMEVKVNNVVIVSAVDEALV